MKSSLDLLKVAEKYLNYGGATFRKWCGLPAGAAYCNAFVCYVFAQGEDASLYYGGKKVTYCPTSYQWCVQNLAQIPVYLAMPCDVVYFDWNINGVPDHIGFARERVSDQVLNTIEGNTSKTNSKGEVIATGVVAYKKRDAKYICGVFRPHFKPTDFSKTKALEIDGQFGYNSISMLQKALGLKQTAILDKATVKALQKKAKATADGSWGTKTSKAVQKMIRVKADGCFGEESVKALQKWINATNKQVATLTKAQKISDEAIRLSWNKGTASKEYAYNGGSACASFKTAWKKYFPDGKNASACINFVKLVLKCLGYGTMDTNGWDKVLAWLKKNFMQVAFTYKESQLKAGDIWVRKDVKNGKTSYHIMIIVEIDGKLMIAESQQSKTYSHINTNIKKALQSHSKVWLFRAQ